MKTVTVKEAKEKVNRLRELGDKGFNTPRFCFVIYRAPQRIIDMSLKWAQEVHKQDPEQIFNIRTYAYDEKSKNETILTPHITDIEFKDLRKELFIANSEFSCMIDAETPDNGRMAGNVAIIEKKGFLSKRIEFALDYCVKDKRAMVRDANISFLGTIEDLQKMRIPFNEEKVLKQVIFEASKLYKIKENFILEWTYFCKPAGVKLEPLVWWEYRKYE